MKYLVVNRSNAQVAVTVVKPSGDKDTVFVQPKSKVTLAEGWKVHSEFLALNSHVQVTLLDPPSPATPEVARPVEDKKTSTK